jgi:hypothetical protein
MGDREGFSGSSGSKNRWRPNAGQGNVRAGKALSLIEAENRIHKEEDK